PTQQNFYFVAFAQARIKRDRRAAKTRANPDLKTKPEQNTKTTAATTRALPPFIPILKKSRHSEARVLRLPALCKHKPYIFLYEI
ncbi:MAG: hypothetical protein ACI3VY_00465, partial [Faecousia sp.]